MTMRSMLSDVSDGKPCSASISPSLRIIGGAPTDMWRSEPLESTSRFNRRSISAVGPALLVADKLERLSLGGGRLGLAGGRSMSASMLTGNGALMPYDGSGGAG